MAGILDFDPNRELGFSPSRELGFSPGRGRSFDPNRGLGFNANRDLGFGKKGVVFRGYVCPICGASVTEDQPSCTECGAVFERKGGAPPPKTMPPRRTEQPPPPRRPMPPPGNAYPMPPKRPEIAHCTFCGARLSRDDAFCWNCGNRAEAPRR